MAIAEFAPGSQLVAGKRMFTGGGLYKQPNKNWETVQFAICKRCRRFNRQKGVQPITHCSACGEGIASNVPFYSGEMIRPEFGFVSQYQRKLPVAGNKRPVRLYSSRVYFDDYHVPDHLANQLGPDDHNEALALVPEVSTARAEIRARYSRFGQLALVNHGPEGRGFRVCQNCGYADGETKPPVVGGRRRRGSAPSKHKNPRTNMDCTGFMKTYRLGHEFLTDVLELQINGPLVQQVAAPEGKDMWRSLLYALLEGSSNALGIRRTDLNGTVYYPTATQPPSLVLYDDVPGGAGHVRRIRGALQTIFQAAYERLDSCECGLETACHECLWNFYNQPFHDTLSRGAALSMLSGLIR
ncbi:MAG: DUF1998 domain-containing protein [Anaerolineales bacterium]|nr:DUF1998 domain-containing protein [Anaerolineales bacterium]